MLNRDKDFGECGLNSYGWVYYQDERYFNKAGEELDVTGNLIEKELQEAVTAPQKGLKPKPIPKPRGRRKVAANPLSGATK